MKLLFSTVHLMFFGLVMFCFVKKKHPGPLTMLAEVLAATFKMVSVPNSTGLELLDSFK